MIFFGVISYIYVLAATLFDTLIMTTGKILGYIGLTILVAFVIFVFPFVRSCNNGFGYQAGSGLGTLVDIDKEKYKSEYIEKYVDTFFKLYPQYLPTPGDLAKQMTSGYEFLNMTNIYFDKYPRETYCVQWSGTGFISVRFAYNYETREEVIENVRANSIIADGVKERMTKRLRTEILDKIDDIISKSKDSTIAIWKSPFDKQ